VALAGWPIGLLTFGACVTCDALTPKNAGRRVSLVCARDEMADSPVLHCVCKNLRAARQVPPSHTVRTVLNF
jgi:hypothetical protein